MNRKTIIAFFFSFVLAGYLHSQPTGNDLTKLKWLEGTWTRTNAKAGWGGNERWLQSSPTEWQGYGITLKGTDTVFLEKLKIAVKDGSIYYVADVPGNKEPVLFRFTTLTENSFACENLQHDFPKKIVYEKREDTLKAVISGNGKSINYLFKKENK
ncbi:MAG: DUF6265 family protein [Bacteroidota bacterium]